MSAHMRRHGERETGAAAVELGMLLMVMAIVATFLFPVGEAYIAKIRLGRASGDALRFATDAPNTPAYGSSGRRPSADDIKAEAIRAYEAQGGSGLTAADVDVTTADVPGGAVTVHITKSVDLGPLGSFLSAVNVTNSQSITVSADATGREE